MKRSNMSHRFKIHSLKNYLDSDGHINSLISLGAFVIFAAAVWFGGPLLTWGHLAPLATPEKRLYIILFFFLIWLLKLLMLDLEPDEKIQMADNETSKKLRALQSRFRGVNQFLKKTITSKNGKSVKLNQLPWYLLIGPPQSGKTSLLANSHVNFILQRQFSSQNTQHLDPSEHCDWWITRDISIIDVPSRYFQLQKPGNLPVLWNYFLNMIRQRRGKNTIANIIIALPLPEIMKQGDTKKYHHLLQTLFQRIDEMQQLFTHPIPCYLAITKCDLLTGFDQFFAEASNEEIAQPWGVTLPNTKGNEKIHDLFAQRFNALIKKLNQQLLWRLHQERNPMARPYIKDFPLQVERLKEFTLDFIKRFSAANFKLTLQGVYLSSSLQEKLQEENNIIDEQANSTQREVQLFKEPHPASRAYFTKQFITQSLVAHENDDYSFDKTTWARRAAYAASIAIVATAVTMLGRDFQQGVKQSRALQNNLSDYRLAIQKFQNPDEHLMQTLALLNILQQSAKNTNLKQDIMYLLTFYSQKSQQKVTAAYSQALQVILIPEVKNYIGEYLKNPVNKNAENIYGALKSYLMLGDANHFDGKFVLNTMQQILPASIPKEKVMQILSHLDLALKTTYTAQPLDTNLVYQTRQYLAAMPSFQLGYLILQNFNSNNMASNIILTPNTNVFANPQPERIIPSMFTGKAFMSVMTDETVLAANEANNGNWVLGDVIPTNKTPEIASALVDQLRNTYVSNYIAVWENVIANVRLTTPTDLPQMNTMIQHLVSNNSPLLQLLQTLHDNTYFEPITTASPKLLDLGVLVDKNKPSDDLLYQIFTGLHSLQQMLQKVLSSSNEKKAAFEAVANRMQNTGVMDPLTQLHMIANKSPEPIKNWLDKLANDTWHYLLQDASHYMDTSWQEQVSHVYLSEIANRYPFKSTSHHEVDIQQFIAFFGNPGIVNNYYRHYLQAFVDTSKADWRWKSVDNVKLPFSDETLRHVQQAMRIHQAFFPNGDNKLAVPFTLQPYQIAKNIKTIKININDKQIIDAKNTSKIPHAIVWPSNYQIKSTSLQLITSDRKAISRSFPGEWGWFRLVNSTFESASSHKQIVMNLSAGANGAKYILSTNGQFNPFMSLNLNHFKLPEQLIENKS